MNHFPEASSFGFITDNSSLDKEESVVIDSKEYPKYIPEPKFLDERDILFKSYYAPEYDNFKQLFKAHTTSYDFYMDIPSQRISPPKSSPSAPVVTKKASSNAFPASYQDEVEEFANILSGLSSKMNTIESAILDQSITQFQRLKQKCRDEPSVDNVNSLRELHAKLLQTYASYLDSI